MFFKHFLMWLNIQFMVQVLNCNHWNSEKLIEINIRTDFSSLIEIKLSKISDFVRNFVCAHLNWKQQRDIDRYASIDWNAWGNSINKVCLRVKDVENEIAMPWEIMKIKSNLINSFMHLWSRCACVHIIVNFLKFILLKSRWWLGSSSIANTKTG